MIALFVLLYVLVGIGASVVLRPVGDAIEAGHLAPTLGFLTIAIVSIVEALSVLATALVILR